jgi:hypothetical protein
VVELLVDPVRRLRDLQSSCLYADRVPLGPWSPKRIERHERTLESSTRPSIVSTDAGRAYVKSMGNPEGLHALVSEFVGSQLADQLGLRTLEFNLIQIDPTQVQIPLDADDEKPWSERTFALPGPGFISREVRASPWGGTGPELDKLINPDDLTRLVLLDTWVLNIDRHPRRPPHELLGARRPNFDNVLLEDVVRGRKLRSRLIAMDFTHAFAMRQGELRRRYEIGLVKDEGVYGLFPQFEPFIRERAAENGCMDLREIVRAPARIDEVLGRIPKEWCADDSIRLALRNFLLERAAYLVDDFLAHLRREVHSLPRTPMLPYEDDA